MHAELVSHIMSLDTRIQQRIVHSFQYALQRKNIGLGEDTLQSQELSGAQQDTQEGLDTKKEQHEVLMKLYESTSEILQQMQNDKNDLLEEVTKSSLMRQIMQDEQYTRTPMQYLPGKIVGMLRDGKELEELKELSEDHDALKKYVVLALETLLSHSKKSGTDTPLNVEEQIEKKAHEFSQYDQDGIFIVFMRSVYHVVKDMIIYLSILCHKDAFDDNTLNMICNAVNQQKTYKQSLKTAKDMYNSYTQSQSISEAMIDESITALIEIAIQEKINMVEDHFKKIYFELKQYVFLLVREILSKNVEAHVTNIAFDPRFMTRYQILCLKIALEKSRVDTLSKRKEYLNMHSKIRYPYIWEQESNVEVSWEQESISDASWKKWLSACQEHFETEGQINSIDVQKKLHSVLGNGKRNYVALNLWTSNGSDSGSDTSESGSDSSEFEVSSEVEELCLQQIFKTTEQDFINNMTMDYRLSKYSKLVSTDIVRDVGAAPKWHANMKHSIWTEKNYSGSELKCNTIDMIRIAREQDESVSCIMHNFWHSCIEQMMDYACMLGTHLNAHQKCIARFLITQMMGLNLRRHIRTMVKLHETEIKLARCQALHKKHENMAESLRDNTSEQEQQLENSTVIATRTEQWNYLFFNSDGTRRDS